MSPAMRDRTSLVLAIAGAVLLLAGTILLYAREQVLDADSFADKAEVALEDDRVRDVVAREIVVNLLENGSANLVAGRPVLESTRYYLRLHASGRNHEAIEAEPISMEVGALR